MFIQSYSLSTYTYSKTSSVNLFHILLGGVGLVRSDLFALAVRLDVNVAQDNRCSRFYLGLDGHTKTQFNISVGKRNTYSW